MKKAILTFGLLSMVMVLTSFTTPTGDDDAARGTGGTGGGGTSTGTLSPGGSKRPDFSDNRIINETGINDAAKGGTVSPGGSKRPD